MRHIEPQAQVLLFIFSAKFFIKGFSNYGIFWAALEEMCYILNLNKIKSSQVKSRHLFIAHFKTKCFTKS